MRGSTLALGAVLALTVAACAAGTGETTTTTSTTQPQAEETTTTMRQPQPAPDVDLNAVPEWFQNEDAAPETLVEAIGERLDANYMGSMAVEWPTSGLGCSSGGVDLQVITPGYVIFYDAEGTLVRVHASETGNWKECPIGRPLEGVPTVTS